LADSVDCGIDAGHATFRIRDEIAHTLHAYCNDPEGDRKAAAEEIRRDAN
jgi:hypothetical protein